MDQNKDNEFDKLKASMTDAEKKRYPFPLDKDPSEFNQAQKKILKRLKEARHKKKIYARKRVERYDILQLATCLVCEVGLRKDESCDTIVCPNCKNESSWEEIGERYKGEIQKLMQENRSHAMSKRWEETNKDEIARNELLENMKRGISSSSNRLKKRPSEEIREKARVKAKAYRESLSKEQHEEQKAKKREYAKKDRKNNPEKYKEIDKKQYQKRMASMTVDQLEREAERHRLKARNQNMKKTSTDNRAHREVQRENGTGRFKKCPVCGHCHESRISDYCTDHRRQDSKIKEREEEVRKWLWDEWNMIPCLEDKKGPCGDAKNLRRSDFVLYGHDINYTIIVEVDEDAHASYPLECEVARLADLRDQIVGKPLYFVRFGVSRISSNRNTVSSSSKKELRNCLEMIMNLPAPKEDENPLGYKMVFINYPPERAINFDETRRRMHEEALQKLSRIEEERKKRDKSSSNI